jgi:hypothetical protein
MRHLWLIFGWSALLIILLIPMSDSPRFVALVSLLELPSIGWQLFILDRSQSDPKALPAFLDTYATRLLTEPLIPSPHVKICFLTPLEATSGSRCTSV